MAQFVEIYIRDSDNKVLMNVDHIAGFIYDSDGNVAFADAIDGEIRLVDHTIDEIKAKLGIAPPKQPLMHEVHLEPRDTKLFKEWLDAQSEATSPTPVTISKREKRLAQLLREIVDNEDVDIYHDEIK
jgi:hypothetical protein